MSRIIDRWTEKGFNLRLREDGADTFTVQVQSQSTLRWDYISGETTLPQRLKAVLAEREDLLEALATSENDALKYRETARILADGLFKSASGTIEGPDIENLLEKAGLIAWETYDPDNLEHAGLAEHFDFEIDEGDQFWRRTDFAKELLKHDNPQRGESDDVDR